MTVILQNKLRPGKILEALIGLTDHHITAIRIAVAYTTYSGSSLLVSRLSTSMGDDIWRDIPKTIITSFDYGITEPQALTLLANTPNSVVRIANTQVLSQGLRPAVSFHPKMYIFSKGYAYSTVIGSANLTASALTSNTEVVYVDEAVADTSLLDNQWDGILEETEGLSPTLLNAYQDIRGKTNISVERNERIIREIENVANIPAIDNLATSGTLDLNKFDHLWIEAGTMSSGGSHNQLELPRGGHRFFGFAFSDYSNKNVTPIGSVTIVARNDVWRDRPLRWHGNNRMERLNLPTESENGFDYRNTAILFRRTSRGFEIEVSPWTDPLSVSWQNASVALGTVYRFSTRSDRHYGLF